MPFEKSEYLERIAKTKARMADKGVDASRMSAVGYGASQPLADNVTAAGRASNRRIEFRFEGN